MPRTPDAVMLFAAGFGTRMGDLTRDRPKPLVEVSGRPLIDHAIDLARAIEPSRLVANLHYKADMLAAHLEPRGVLLSREEPEILDTGGGLKAALPMLGPEPAFTMNTDALWSGPNPLKLLRQAWNPDVMDVLLMCVHVSRTIGHSGKGDFAIDRSGQLRRGGDMVYSGLQIVRTDGLADISDPVFSLNVLWDQIIRRGRAYALEYPGRWCDVGHPTGITLAEALLRDTNV